MSSAEPVPCALCATSLSPTDMREHLRVDHSVPDGSPFHSLYLGRTIRHGSPPAIIDALNVIRHFGPHDAKLELLWSILLDMAEQNKDFLCVFWPNTEVVLKKQQTWGHAAIYSRLLRAAPRYFAQVPAGTDAADLILPIAGFLEAPVISNNKFRESLTQYPWLGTDDRLVSFDVRNNQIYYADRSIPLLRGIGPMTKRLRQQLKIKHW